MRKSVKRKPRTAVAYIAWVKEGGFCYAYLHRKRKMVVEDCRYHSWKPDAILKVRITELRPPKARRTKPTK